MSGHADTIRALLPSRGSRTSVWWSVEESEAAHADLDALLAENQRYEKALQRRNEFLRVEADVLNRLADLGDCQVAARTLRAHAIDCEALAGDTE